MTFVPSAGALLQRDVGEGAADGLGLGADENVGGRRIGGLAEA